MKLTGASELLQKLVSGSGVAIERLLRHHSYLGYTRMVSAGHADVEISCQKDLYTNMQVLSLSLPTGVAHFCLECVREDIDFHGVSYWRRFHQLPGIDVCPKHASVLQEVPAPKVLYGLPSATANALPALNGSALPLHVKNPIIQRFTTLSDMALHLNRPIAPAVMASVLSGRRQELGGAMLAQPLATTVRKMAPFNWLEKHFPKLASQELGQRVSSIDDVLRSRHVAHATKSYLLIMAILWDSPEEAMNACLGAAKKNSTGLNKVGGEHAVRAVLKGKSINAACKAAGVHQRDFEHALRTLMAASREAA